MTRIERRALFTSGAAAALLAASGVSLAAAPRTGGRLRLAVPEQENDLPTPARGAIFDTLTEMAADGVLRGELATAWHGSPDARQWDIHLRDDVRFHGGDALGAADVAAALLAHDSPLLADVTGIEALGPHHIRLSLAKGDPNLPFILAHPDLIISRVRTDDAADLPDGTGLYAPDQLRPGRRVAATRAASHYKDGSAGWFDSLEIVVIPDAAVRAEALRDGYVDVAELPLRDGLLGRGEFRFHPSARDMAFATSPAIATPQVIGTGAPLDDGRLAERWWFA